MFTRLISSTFVRNRLVFLSSVEIDPSIPALRCELLPESTSEETLFISISPFSGLYKVVCYMGKVDWGLSLRLFTFVSCLLKKRVSVNRLNLLSIGIRAISSKLSINSSMRHLQNVLWDGLSVLQSLVNPTTNPFVTCSCELPRLHTITIVESQTWIDCSLHQS